MTRRGHKSFAKGCSVGRRAATRRREDAILGGIHDSLLRELGERMDSCSDELRVGVGIFAEAGCKRCPVEAECQRLWKEVEEGFGHNLRMREFRQYSQRLHALREKRNAILKRRGVKPKAAVTL